MAPQSSRYSIPIPPGHRRPRHVGTAFSRLRVEQLEGRIAPALFNVQSPQSFTGLSNNGSVVAADFNKDGFTDAALTNFGTGYGGGDGTIPGTTITVLYGRTDGSGGFVRDQLNTGGSNVSFVSIADINGDTWLDLIVSNANQQNTGSVSVFENDGAGNFSLVGTPFSTFGNNASWVGMADITGDGKLDAVVSNFGKVDGATVTGNNVTVFQGNGDFTFVASPVTTLAPEIQFVPTSLAVDDFDGDGFQDIAAVSPGVPTSEGGPYPPGTIYVFSGTGSGGFGTPNQEDSGGVFPVNIQVADLNGNGKKDLIVANAGDPNHAIEFTGNSVGVLLNVSSSGNVNFSAPTSLTANTYGTFAVAVADFDLDGDADIASVNHGFYQATSPPAFVSIYLGNGAGAFTPPAPPIPGKYDTGTGLGGGQYLAVGNFDSVGSPDLIVAHSSNLVGLLYNTTVAGPSVTINQGSSQADPTNATSIVFDVVFSEGVSGFAAGDVDLSASSVGGLSALVTPVSSTVYTVTVTGMAGTGTVRASIPAGAATSISDSVATRASTSTDNQVTFDLVAPTVTINQASGQADPASSGPILFTVVFSENVTGFGNGDVDLSASSLSGLSATVTQNTPSNYTVSVSGMSGNGTVIARVVASAASDAAGNASAASTSGDNSVTFGASAAPSVTINQGSSQPDPTKATSIVFDVVFSVGVTGFAGGDIDFTGSTVGGLSASVTPISTTQYTVAVTGMAGTGTVQVSIPAGAATSISGSVASQASTSNDNQVTFDLVSPTVTINQANAQADPASSGPILFTVVFSENVTGFVNNHVDLSSSSLSGLSATVTQNTPSNYTVSVSGMSGNGTVVAKIVAGAGSDSVGNASAASTSGDNSVTFVNANTLGFSQAIYNTTEDAAIHTVTITVTRAGQTAGAVSINYGTSDGTAHSGGFASTGQDDYTPTGGTLSWADGEGGDKTFTIDILPDALNEGKELINLALTNPVGNPVLGLTVATAAIAPSDGLGQGLYLDQDGDKFRIRLNGKTGSMQFFRTDSDGDSKGPIELIELNGTLPDPLRPRASLVISVTKSKTSTDGGTVGLGAITGTGLRSISARKANLNLEGINLTGYLGALTIGNIVNGADITTLSTTNPKQKTRISALAILDGTTIDVGARVSSLTATSFGAGSFKAPAAGTINIKGAMAADVNITGVGVSTSERALAVLRVKGAVTGSDIIVNGNVGSVVVGAFRDSRLFAGYTGADDGSGTFNLPATVTSFRSTGKIDGFQNSRVIATFIKSATITNLDSTNSANFGFYAGSVGALSVIGPTKFKFDPTLSARQGVDDFEVMIVV